MSQPTERQSPDEQDFARNLSVQRTAPPATVPGYETRRFLGSGAYGEVWVALDQTTGRQVAIKFYTHRTRIDWSLLSREVEKLVFLSADRYVVQLLDVGWDADPPYYVMEYMEHGSLAQYLQRVTTLSVTESVAIIQDVATGLLHAHQKGVLHCDLKPANILLDQDFKPRLADFGQSRLSHEQTPALGTLFYMAPEQADLNAVPDARWDVYGLGAILFCMLTGNPPHRNQIDTTNLDSVASLTKRLEDYRQRIYALPPVNEHRKVPHIDRALIEILDRCLAIQPERRYPNVQSVLEALAARERQRSRRPLMVLGFVGPLLLLSITGLFGWFGYQRSLSDSDKMLTRRALESNQFAAEFVAEAASRRIDRYFREVEQVAQLAELRTDLEQVLDDAQLADTWTALTEHARDTPPPSKDQIKQTAQPLIQHPTREKLDRLLTTRLNAPSDLKVASWFIVSPLGIQLAAAYGIDAPASQLGVNFAYRTYFHGGPEDLKWAEVTTPPTHISSTHLSTIFQSTATGHWKMAVSTPIINDAGRFLGVLALTIDLGSIVDFPKTNPNLFVVLVDGREGDKRGVILEHPLLQQLIQTEKTVPSHFQSNYRVQLDHWPTDGNANYIDPLSEDDRGAAYRKRWIAAQKEVRLNKPNQPATVSARSGLVVLVQEDHASIAAPVEQLGQFLTRQGLLALFTFASVLTLLWFAVLRLLREPFTALKKRQFADIPEASAASADTLEFPSRLRQRRP